MECRKLDISVHEAKDLTHIRHLGKTKAYAKVSINGDSRSAKETTVDKQNNCNPVWNSTVTHTITEKSVQEGASDEIVITLFCKRSGKWDADIGEVKFTIWKLFKEGPCGHIINHPVGGTAGGSGTAGGTLSISYKFGEKFTLVRQPPRRSSGLAGKIMTEIGITVAAGVLGTYVEDIIGGDDDPMGDDIITGDDDPVNDDPMGDEPNPRY